MRVKKEGDFPDVPKPDDQVTKFVYKVQTGHRGK